MSKTGLLPPEYSPPAHENIGYVEAGVSSDAFPPSAEIMTAEQRDNSVNDTEIH